MVNTNQNIPGWFTYASLYDEVVEKYGQGPANFIEIGCWFGRSATYMLEKLKDADSSIHTFFLDTWLGGKEEPVEQGLVEEKGIDYVYDSFCENVSKIGYKNIHILRDDSVRGAANFPEEFFDFIFIDAGHKYWQCYDDMRAWYPKLRAEGTMAGHDIDCEDVERSVKRFADEYHIDIEYIRSPVQCWRFIK